MISLVLTARPSYAKLQPIIAALRARQATMEVVCCASSLLVRYGRVVDQVRSDFPDVPVTEVYSTLEGSTLQTGAKDVGVLVTGLADHFARIRPRFVVVTADRYETIGAAIAARYQNIPVVHIQGGERSGNIDDVVRDANTALAAYHFPATELAKYRIYSLTGQYEHIWNVGCPSVDVALWAQADPPVTSTELGGTGADVDLNGPFILMLQHGDTERVHAAYQQLRTTLDACQDAHLPLVCFWPGQDAGQEDASKAIRVYCQQYAQYPIRTVRTLPPRRFLRLLSQTTVLVGNSSAGIREASAVGTPVVNVGDRQSGRQRAGHVADVPHERGFIAGALKRQARHGRYERSDLYGTGTASRQIADILTSL